MQVLSLATGLLLLAVAGVCDAHNITIILSKHPEFSTFNHYLSATHLDTEINRRLTITVLAVDNSAMAALLSKHYTISTIKNVLSLHILADYYGSKHLHQIAHRSTVSASLFQATGAAPGTTGYVNITDLKGGHVAFGADDNNGILDSRFVKAIKEIPYKISVIQVSHLLSSPEAEAPTPPPAAYNLTELMGKKGCKLFADLVSSTGDVEETFENSVEAGLTIFCPNDQAMKKFMPKYRNLTSEAKTSLLLYHGLPLYNSMQMLKTSTGKVDTFATNAKTRSYNYTFHDTGEVVKIDTRINSAKVTGTVIDEQPLAIYAVDKVLEPNELFKVPEAAPPSKAAKVVGEDDDADAPSEDDTTDDDETADDKDGGVRLVGKGGWWVVVAMVVATLLA